MGYIKLDKKAFENNINYYANILQTKDKICIALKDNAYGHGLEQIGELCSIYGIKHSMVRDINEATKALQYNFDTILVLYDIPQKYDDRFIFSINDIDKIKWYPPYTKVELKLDTGMGRNGIQLQDIPYAIELIQKYNLELKGVFTHFCCADEDDTKTAKQEKLFQKAIQEIKTLINTPFRVHCANSVGVHKVDNSLYDIARIGIGLYGYLDIKELSTKVTPILSLYAKKISTRVLKKGDTVNYGATFKAPYDNFIISNYDIGYSDGFFRLNERKTTTIQNGKKILGRVSMDSLSVEGEADEICLFDDATSLAILHDTIHYEILTNLKDRLPRVVV